MPIDPNKATQTKPDKEWRLKLRYLPHNLIGHPLMALAQLFGLWRLSRWFHDITLPKETK